jgi:hypothetical protein
MALESDDDSISSHCDTSEHGVLSDDAVDYNEPIDITE